VTGEAAASRIAEVSATDRLAPARLELVPRVWVNGERQTVEGPHVSAADRGLTLADGLFETMLMRHGRVFRLEAHLSRLERGLAALGIPVPAALREWLMRAVDEADASASLRLTVTRGAGATGLAPPRDPVPTVVVTAGRLSPSSIEPPDAVSAPDSLLPRVVAHVASGRRNERSMTAGLKTLSYTDSIAALIEARRAGANEALFLDTEGHCSEASASNQFIWTGRELLTPPVSCGALPGITRAAVMEVATTAGLPAAERAFGLADLLAAPEAFLTSSLRQVMPLVTVNGAAIGTGATGPRTYELALAYDALVTRECGG
jgi:branched-chain amino acid aminotransferase